MMSLLEEFCQFCMVLWKILCLSLVDVAKSLVPCGWLPKKSVRGKIVLITGSGNGLGRSMACEFAKLGARLVLWDIDARMNAETKQMVDQIGNYEAAAYQVDLSKREQIYATAERVHQDMGAWPDILVNNAGIAYAKEIVELPDNVIEAIMAVNCTALFYTAKAFLPGMVARREGHIVNIASMAGIVGVNRLAAYCVSKHGAIGFSDTLRAEIDELQVPIRVTTVCPYYVNTNMATGIQTFSRLLPILEPAYVVERIMEAVLTEAEALYLPWASNLLVAFKGLFSSRVGLVVLKYLGVNRGTETWQEQKATATATMQNGNAN